jgi:hypothetical protein
LETAGTIINFEIPEFYPVRDISEIYLARDIIIIYLTGYISARNA